MIFEKERWEVWNITQHPYKHSLAEFSFINPALPGVSNVESALNYILAVLYPQTKENVATPGDLPSAGNTVGDYRIVDDDGDGKSAGYRWEQREGDVAASWYKIFDVDWSTDAILAAMTNVTDIRYVHTLGKSDADENGDEITGLYAGQRVFGGNQANQNFTLHANSGDGVGAQTGFVQIDSQFRPTLDDTFDLSTATERWRNAHFSGTINIGTLALSGGSIADSSGAIDFGAAALSTTGNISGGTVTGTSLVANDTTNLVTLVPGSYTDSSGAVTFGAAALSTTGTLGAGVTTFTSASQSVVINPDNGASRSSITSTHGAIDFGDEDLYTTGVLNAGSISVSLLNIDNLRLDGNTLSTTDTNGNLVLSADGTGLIDLQNTLQTLGINSTGSVVVTGLLDVDNIRIDGNGISATNLNGDLNLSVNGTGNIVYGASLVPSVSGSFDLGTGTNLTNDIYVSGGIRNATNEIPIGTLLSFRHALFRDVAQTQPAQNNDTIFYDFGNNVWLASAPDTEITHGAVSGLTTGDAGHTQFAMLAGRVGGQTISGGTAASENLLLESTVNATKGTVRTKDSFLPDSDAVFSGGWSGLDLGSSTNNFRDVYSKGEFKGFRLENIDTAGIPAASAQNIGRIVFNTDNNKALVDIGTAFKTLGVSKFSQDQAFNGTDLVKDVDVSSEIEDARTAIFSLLNNVNNFSKMYVSLKAISATTIRIETDAPLPVGSYRLVVIE